MAIPSSIIMEMYVKLTLRAMAILDFLQQYIISVIMRQMTTDGLN